MGLNIFLSHLFSVLEEFSLFLEVARIHFSATLPMQPTAQVHTHYTVQNTKYPPTQPTKI